MKKRKINWKVGFNLALFSTILSLTIFGLSSFGSMTNSSLSSRAEGKLLQVKRAFALKDQETQQAGPYQPIDAAYRTQNPETLSEGKALVAQGKYACLLVAGGQGSRLGFPKPKGLFPVSAVKQKTLFQIFAEKVKACSLCVKQNLFLAIMVSHESLEEVQDYFASHEYFGLLKEQVDFFVQEDLPFLDMEGKSFYQSEGQLASGPDGNGSSLEALVRAPFFSKWEAAGVEGFSFVLIDNPLADPFDFELLAFHAKQNNQVTVKATQRMDPNEKVGVLLKSNQGITVVEYSEIGEREQKSTDESGKLVFNCANLSLFCFDMTFVKSLLQKKPLPLHAAVKEVAFYNPETKEQGTKKAYKFEKFIFDVLPLADANRVKVILFPREECFSPLKNKTGKDSPETVQKDLIKRDKQVFSQLSGKKIVNEIFEISQRFYYPTTELIKRAPKLEPNEEFYVE